MTDHDRARRAESLLAQALEILRPIKEARGDANSASAEGWPLHLATVQTGLAQHNLRAWLDKTDPVEIPPLPH